MYNNDMNKLTLLIDGNWLMMSRMPLFIKDFDTTQREEVRQQASTKLEMQMAKSIGVILNRFKNIDNMKATITKINLEGKTLYAYVIGKSDNGLILYTQNRLIKVKDNNIEIIEDYIVNLQFDLALQEIENKIATKTN